MVACGMQCTKIKLTGQFRSNTPVPVCTREKGFAKQKRFR